MPLSKTTSTLLARSSKLLVALLILACFASCAAEGVQRRTDRRSGILEKSATNREIRQDARDQRYEEWFDRIKD
jgi:hypothetical protein